MLHEPKKMKIVLLFSIIVIFCSLLVPGLEVLNPRLGIIGMLFSIMIINGSLRRMPIRESLPLLLSAAIIVSGINYLVLGVSCSNHPLPICEWNFLFFSLFFGGLLLLGFALDQLVAYSSKRKLR